MEIMKLPVGERADDGADCIRIQTLSDGRYQLNCSALFDCGDTDGAESVSLIGGDTYRSYEEAEAAGVAWASDHCVETLYVSRSDGLMPLPDIGE